MNTIFRQCVMVIFALYLPIIYGYNFVDPNEKDLDIEYVGDKKKNKNLNERHDTYSKLKTVLQTSIVNDYIPNVAAVYFLTKRDQKEITAIAVSAGVVTGFCTGFAPFTFGLTMFIGAPAAGFCVSSSVCAHKFRKLKRRAKSYLRASLYPRIFEHVRHLSETTSNISLLFELLRAEGFDLERVSFKYR